MPAIRSIAIKPEGTPSRPADRFARIAVQQATLVAGQGLEGDRKGSGGDRQLNIMCMATLVEMQKAGCRIDPGEMGEQIVLDDIVIESLPNGAMLRVEGGALIEVVQLRTPCSRFERIQNVTIKDAWGRVGVMARVVRGGPIRIGDSVSVVDIDRDKKSLPIEAAG
jgi:MOSC domain-containing protein YiiM